MSKYRGNPKEERALSAFVALLRASNAAHSEATRHLAAHNLTPSQFAVLEALFHVGPLCLTELAHKILRTSGNLTMVVDNLEKRALVRRVQGSKDRRYTSVEITDAGQKLIREIFPEHAQGIVGVMSSLTAGEQETLRELCRKLGLSIESREEAET